MTALWPADADTPGVAEPVYPGLISWPQSFVDYVHSLSRKSKDKTLIIILCTIFGTLALIGLIALITVFVLQKLYAIFFISKETVSESDWT